jgi:hypothetical protein
VPTVPTNPSTLDLQINDDDDWLLGMIALDCNRADWVRENRLPPRFLEENFCNLQQN